MSAMSDQDKKDTLREFKTVVNMTPAALRKWLESAESKTVGMTHEGEKVTGESQPEAVGHEMGGKILHIKATKAADLTDEDYAAMRKVVGYVHRHGKQHPHGDIADTRWRKSLMNWGHDPLKS